jgi:tRNA-2-methylthio-N6-dimethylallyladenosine synthase
MAENPKVCPYLHIPAQSGSDRILKAMNRGYTAAEYIELMDKARAIVPDIALAGDFIVGFPGETDDDFQQTVELVRRVRYKNAFVFKYSPRPGTHADTKLADDVAAEVKQQRNVKLLEVISEIAEEDNQRFLGQTLEVLVEGPSKKPHLNRRRKRQPSPAHRPHRRHDYIVVFNGPETLTGRFVPRQNHQNRRPDPVCRTDE